MKKISIILFDNGYKTYAPALMSLSNQTIINDCEIFWIEYGDKLFPEVLNYDFVTPIMLKKKETFNVSYCYNAGAYLASNSYVWLLLDPCLWCYPTFLEDLYNFHLKNTCMSHNIELRGNENEPHPVEYSDVFYEDFIVKHGGYIDTNFGCGTAIRTEYVKDLGGFDCLIEGDGTINNSVRLFYFRAKNKYNMQKKLITKILYHAWHPHDYSMTNVRKLEQIEHKYTTEKIIDVIGGFDSVKDLV